MGPVSCETESLKIICSLFVTIIVINGRLWVELAGNNLTIRLNYLPLPKMQQFIGWVHVISQSVFPYERLTMPTPVARLIIKENKKLWETILKKIFF